jgi:hypothetical protein
MGREEEEGGGRGDVYVIAKPLKEIIDIGSGSWEPRGWPSHKGVAETTPFFFFFEKYFLIFC